MNQVFPTPTDLGREQLAFLRFQYDGNALSISAEPEKGDSKERVALWVVRHIADDLERSGVVFEAYQRQQLDPDQEVTDRIRVWTAQLPLALEVLSPLVPEEVVTFLRSR